DTYGDPNEVNTYDWQGKSMKKGFQQKFNASARGGSDVTQFFLSGSFAGIEGTFKKSDFNLATLRANIDHQATDRFRFELNMNLGRSKAIGRYGQNTATGGNNGIQSPWHSGVTTSVTIPIYNEDGTYNQDIPAVDYNQIQLLDVEERWTRRLETVGNLSA